MAEGAQDDRPLIVMTGATGNVGSSLVDALAEDFKIVGLDRHGSSDKAEIIEVDVTSPQSVDLAFEKIASEHGRHIAAVIHLIAYFDFSGEPDPKYQTVNVDGTRNLFAVLEKFEVERFIYASTMLVHEPARPGERINEDTPFGPRWEYPQSKKKVEDAIRECAGDTPYAILRLAGVYDEGSAVPTLSHQIARIYERKMESHMYSGALNAGQSMLHKEDMTDAFARAVAHRKDLPQHTELLIGEPFALGYDALQERLGTLIHGEEDWETIKVPKPVAKLGAAAQEQMEPVVPDAIDQGETPFIKPFMVEMADDHYALDIKRAEELLGWRPKHRLEDELPAMVANLKADPAAWYERNKITPPEWVDEAEEHGDDPEALRKRVETRRIAQHRQFRWPHFLNLALAVWLMTQPRLIGLEPALYSWAEVVLGAALLATATLSLSWRMSWARWLSAGIGMTVMALPMIFITPNAAAYLSDTLVGALIFGFAIAAPPEVGPSITARDPVPEVPPGWSFNPSAWTQRIPIIALAVIGIVVSRYLAAYQMDQVDGVWEPFFPGSAADPQNGTEEIITSKVSEAWPVPDAAVGAYTYMLEILTGIVGSRARWRTMPWLVLLFGLMIVPLGIVSITFIIIQPIVIGTWSTLTLVAAAAMLIQIPYSLDELAASLSFLRRRVKKGQSFLRVLLFGDTDEGRAMTQPTLEFERSPRPILRDMWGGAVNMPWSMWLAGAIGVSFLFTRLTLGAEGGMADADHVLGSLILTVLAVAAAEVTRAVRYLLIPLGLGIAAAPFIYESTTLHLVVSVVLGLAVATLSLPRGRITESYGSLDRLIR